MKKLGIILDKLYFDHDNGMGHPESQERLLAILDMLKETKNTRFALVTDMESGEKKEGETQK